MIKVEQQQLYTITRSCSVFPLFFNTYTDTIWTIVSYLSPEGLVTQYRPVLILWEYVRYPSFCWVLEYDVFRKMVDYRKT